MTELLTPEFLKTFGAAAFVIAGLVYALKFTWQELRSRDALAESQRKELQTRLDGVAKENLDMLKNELESRVIEQETNREILARLERVEQALHGLETCCKTLKGGA